METVYKAFYHTGGGYQSLAATGPLKKNYNPEKWTYADKWLLDLGLGLFAFRELHHLRELQGRRDSLPKGMWYADSEVYLCSTTKILRSTPDKMLSMSKHNPENFNEEMVLERLEEGLWDKVEPGAVLCVDIFPYKRIERMRRK